MYTFNGKGCFFSYSDLERPLKSWEVTLSRELNGGVGRQQRFFGRVFQRMLGPEAEKLWKQFGILEKGKVHSGRCR